jgi:hypothetical protein
MTGFGFHSINAESSWQSPSSGEAHRRTGFGPLLPRRSQLSPMIGPPASVLPHIFENTPNKVAASGTISLASRRHSRDEWSCKGTRMTNYPYSLFNKSPEQLRLLGARGGRAYGRSQRDRRAGMQK